MNPVVRGDIVVEDFLNSVGGYRHKERRDILLDILDIDLDWHMHTISDGERRRVQLCFGLMVPFDVLLLDEVCITNHLPLWSEYNVPRSPWTWTSWFVTISSVSSRPTARNEEPRFCASIVKCTSYVV